MLQFGIICLNEAPALNVEVTLDPLPRFLEGWKSRFPLVVPVISREAPFYFDFHIMTMGEDTRPTFRVNLRYADTVDRAHHETLTVDVDKQMGPSLGIQNDLRELERAVRGVADAIKSKR